ANGNDNTVSKVAPDGAVSLFATDVNRPRGLAFDAQGNLYASNFADGTVSQVGPGDGTGSIFASGFAGPPGLALYPQRNLSPPTAPAGAGAKGRTTAPARPSAAAPAHPAAWRWTPAATCSSAATTGC